MDWMLSGRMNSALCIQCKEVPTRRFLYETNNKCVISHSWMCNGEESFIFVLLFSSLAYMLFTLDFLLIFYLFYTLLCDVDCWMRTREVEEERDDRGTERNEKKSSFFHQRHAFYFCNVCVSSIYFFYILTIGF